MLILGISCFYHDSAACLIEDGVIVAAAQEERFTRIKHDQSFPTQAARYCLAEAESFAGKLDAVAFYDKPVLKFHRLLETYFSVAPKGLRAFAQSMPSQLTEKLWIEPRITGTLAQLGVREIGAIYYPEHHESHAASAYYPSPFDEAAVLTIDGVGEWACATLGVGEGSTLRLLEQQDFPHSLGLLYSAFTHFTGFKVNSGEYKLMGLAPYGRGIYTERILEELMDLREDGSFRLDMSYFGFLDDLVMTSERFAELFGGPARSPESAITRRELDLAKSIQEATEEIVLRMARHARALTGKRYLCMAGGVALNCVANGRLLREGIFDDLFSPPAGDAGGALGAALAVWHNELGHQKVTGGVRDAMQGALLGPEFSDEQIRQYLADRGYAATELSQAEWAPRIAKLIADGHVIGLFQGRMEFGPRALGHRSIIGDARSPKMQSVLNLKIKHRESFRPFAPSVLAERAGEYFDLDRASPYMLLVADVRPERRIGVKPASDDALDLHAWINQQRSDVPAITHVDGSARIQTVHADTQPRYHELLSAFERLTGCGLIVNTSFNVRGEPIVCTPSDAYRCFMRTEMDYLVLGSFLLEKKAQSTWTETDNWKVSFQLD